MNKVFFPSRLFCISKLSVMSYAILADLEICQWLLSQKRVDRNRVQELNRMRVPAWELLRFLWVRRRTEGPKWNAATAGLSASTICPRECLSSFMGKVAAWTTKLFFSRMVFLQVNITLLRSIRFSVICFLERKTQWVKLSVQRQ